MFRMIKLLVLMHIVQSRNVFAFDENVTYSIPADANKLCPYTSFCGDDSTLPFTGRGGEVPCCYDCSCDPSCGLHNNCCFKQFDIYNIEETYQMICRSLFSTMNIPDRLKNVYDVAFQPHFRMINKCLDATCNDQEVPNIYVFHPVYSSKTRFIYFNEDVAKCNNVTDVIQSRKAILCSLQNVLPAEFKRVIQDDATNTDCVTKYIFPDNVNLKSEYCEPKVIRKCNVTGEVVTWQPFWDFCETFNATFVLNKSERNYVYGNIYCYMCNEYYEGNPQSGKYRCSEPSVFGKKFGKDHSLTMILKNSLLIEVEKEIDTSGTKIGCPVNHALVHSFSSTCRPIKCSFWKVLLNGKCRFYSEEWIGGNFVIVLRLTSLDGHLKIMRSFVENLIETEKSDKTAKWLKRKTLKNWAIESFYHPSFNESYVDYFVVSAKCPFHFVNPNYIERQVIATLSDIWFISQNEDNIALKIEYNEYTTYSQYFEDSGRILLPGEKEPYQERNASVNFVYVPDIYSEEQENSEITRHITEARLYKISGAIWLHKPEIFLTKLFLCQQVDLFPDEYEDNLKTIFFKVKNITLLNFRRVKGETNAPLSFTNNSSTSAHSVRICLDEFEHTIVFANVKRTFFTNDVMFLMANIILFKVTFMF